MKKELGILCILLSAILLFSCDKKDGDWEAMKWKVENLSPQDIHVDKDKKVINVSSNGGKINLVCTNYSGFWFALFTENGDNIDDVYHHWLGDWYDLTIHDNIMTCTFSEIDPEHPEEALDVPVTAGDIFHDFHIVRTDIE